MRLFLRIRGVVFAVRGKTPEHAVMATPSTACMANPPYIAFNLTTVTAVFRRLTAGVGVGVEHAAVWALPRCSFASALSATVCRALGATSRR